MTGPLKRFETKNFIISQVDLADSNGKITFKASIGGNHYGMAHLIFHAPLLLGRNARFKVNKVEGNTFDITLTQKLCGFENIFKMFPFSAKYGGLEIWAEDGSGENHLSKNQNERFLKETFSCNSRKKA